MSDLKPTGVKIKLGNQEYGMRFTLNVIDDIQEHFDIPISQLGELFTDEKKQIKNLRFLLMKLINEDIDCVMDETGKKIPHVDERYVGRHIDTNNMHELMNLIFRVFSEGIPKAEEDDEIPNAESGRQIS